MSTRATVCAAVISLLSGLSLLSGRSIAQEALPLVDSRTQGSTQTIQGSARTMEFSHDGKYLAVCVGLAKVLEIWDVQSRQLLATPLNNCISLSWSPTANDLAVGGGGSIALVRAESGWRAEQLTELNPSINPNVSYSPNGNKLGWVEAGVPRGRAIVMDLATREVVAERDNVTWAKWTGFISADVMAGVRFERGKQERLWLTQWNIREDKLAPLGHELVLDREAYHRLRFMYQRFHRNLYVLQGTDGVIRIWDALSGRSMRLGAQPEMLVSTAVSHEHLLLATGASNGKAFATGGYVTRTGGTGPVRVWDVRTGQLLMTLNHPGDVHLVQPGAFSADGSLLATSVLYIDGERERLPTLYLWRLNRREADSGSLSDGSVP